MGHLLVLPADDKHHHHQKHVDKHLHAQETEFPVPRVLGIVFKRSIHWNPLIQLCGNHDGNDKYEYQHGEDGHNALRHQQRLERYPQKILNNPPAGEDDNGRKAHGKQDMGRGFLRQHPVDVLTLSAVALAHAHFLGAFHQGRNHNQDVVQQGNQDEQGCHYGK